MTRHTFKNNNTEIAYGWDGRLRTFFFQIYDQEDELLFDAGNFPEELPTVDELQAAIGDRFTLTPEMRESLEKDKAYYGDTRPNASPAMQKFQADMEELLRSLRNK